MIIIINNNYDGLRAGFYKRGVVEDEQLYSYYIVWVVAFKF